MLPGAEQGFQLVFTLILSLCKIHGLETRSTYWVTVHRSNRVQGSYRDTVQSVHDKSVNVFYVKKPPFLSGV